jgi:hypothetical protein
VANKQIDELTELTTGAGSDLVLVYDIDEAGTEKTKKMAVANFNTDWKIVSEFNLSSSAASESIVWDPSTYPEIQIIVHIKNTSGNQPYLRFNSDSGNNYSQGWLAPDGAVVNAGHTASHDEIPLTNSSDGDYYCVWTGHLANYGTRRMLIGHRHGFYSGNTDLMIGVTFWRWNNTSSDITTVDIGSGNITGNIRIYKR